MSSKDDHSRKPKVKKTKAGKTVKPAQTEDVNPVGRPTKYETRFCEMVIKHMGKPASFESFGAIIGVNRDTLYEWRRVHRQFSDAHKIGKLACLGELEKIYRMQMTGQIKGGSAAALIFFTKNVTNWKDDPMPEDDGYEEMEFVE